MPLKTCSVGTGLELFFLHGWGTNSQVFNPLVSQLGEKHRITRVDLPGFGENLSVMPKNYTVDNICYCLREVMDEDIVLVGWSLGGLIAQRFALLFPEKVIGLINIASSPFFMAHRGWPGIQPDILEQFSNQLSTDYKRTVERFLAIQAMGSNSAKQDVKLLKQQLTQAPLPDKSALQHGMHILKTLDLRNQVNRITCPTLRLYGRRDRLVPVSAVDYIHALHPQSDCVILSDASHAPFISHATSCAQIIQQFTTRLDQNGRSTEPTARW